MSYPNNKGHGGKVRTQLPSITRLRSQIYNISTMVYWRGTHPPKRALLRRCEISLKESVWPERKGVGTVEATFGKFCQQKGILNPFHNVSYTLCSIKKGAIMSAVNCLHVGISVTKASSLKTRNSYVWRGAVPLVLPILTYVVILASWNTTNALRQY